MNKGISDKIKVFGFLMTCIIVCYHCPSVDPSFVRGGADTALTVFLNAAMEVLGILAMSHFFAVTGYLLFQKYTLNSYPQKIKRRITTLLVPYVLWQCITVGLKLAVNRETVPFWDFVQKTFFFVRYPYNGALWYVYAIFFLALLSPLLLPLFRSKAAAWCGVLVLITVAEARARIAWPAFRAIADYGYMENILRYLPAYLMGCLCGKFGKGENLWKQLRYPLSAMVLALALECIISGAFYQIAVKMLPLMGLFVLPAVSRLSGKKVLDLAFLIYALHQPLIGVLWSVLGRIYAVVSLPATVCNLTTRAVCLGAAIFSAWVIHTVLKRVSPKLLICLTGGRA